MGCGDVQDNLEDVDNYQEAQEIIKNAWKEAKQDSAFLSRLNILATTESASLEEIREILDNEDFSGYENK